MRNCPGSAVLQLRCDAMFESAGFIGSSPDYGLTCVNADTDLHSRSGWHAHARSCSAKMPLCTDSYALPSIPRGSWNETGRSCLFDPAPSAVQGEGELRFVFFWFRFEVQQGRGVQANLSLEGLWAPAKSSQNVVLKRVNSSNISLRSGNSAWLHWVRDVSRR